MQEILLLHGAIGSKEQLSALSDLLQDRYKIHTINFPGHGDASLSDDPFSIALFAQQVLDHLQENNITRINIFGYSMGGYVGLWIAKHQPSVLNKLITLATKFDWDPQVAANEIKFLDAGKIEQKIPAFAAELKQRHLPGDWKTVLQKTRSMLLEMGEKNPLQPEDYKDIHIPSLLLLGDRDKMITLEESMAVYKQLPNASFGIIPNTAHPIEQSDIQTLSFLIDRFLSK